MKDSFLVAGWKRFIKAQEYRAHCMAVRELRTLGYIKEARDIAAYKHSLYGRFHQCGLQKNMSLNDHE